MLDSKDGNRRSITILIKAKHFTEQNLEKFFNYLSLRYPKPELLYISVFSNRKDLGEEGLQPMMHMRGDDTEMAGDFAIFSRVNNNMRFSLTFKDGESYVFEMD